MVAVVPTLQERPAPGTPYGDCCSMWGMVWLSIPTPVAIWFCDTRYGTCESSSRRTTNLRKMASAVSTASSALLVLVRRLVIAAIGLANAALTPHTASPET